MFEINDIVILKWFHNKYDFYKVTEVDSMIKAKNLEDETERYLTEDEIEKATLRELLICCQEANKRLHLSWIYSDTRKKLEKIIKSLEKECDDFNYLQDPHLDYIFYFGNLTEKEYNELSIIDVFELDIDIDSTYNRALNHIEDYSEEIKMSTLSAIKLGDTEYSINDKCSACKSEEYITRDEAKEMIEEMFNKINNKEIKEMEFSKTMCEKICKEDTRTNILDDYLKEVLREALEKEETKAKPIDELFKNEDTVEAIYINADKKVIVLKWNDGETTKAVCDPQDKFDIEAGVFLALAKRSYFYEEIAARCNWEGITPEMEKGIFFNLAAAAYSDINEIKRYVNWAKKVYAKQTKKEVKPKTSKKVK